MTTRADQASNTVSEIAELPPRLSFGTIFLFILPALAMGFMHGPEQQMQGIYAKYAGLTLAALAGATLLTRAFDARRRDGGTTAYSGPKPQSDQS